MNVSLKHAGGFSFSVNRTPKQKSWIHHFIAATQYRVAQKSKLYILVDISTK